MGISYRPNSGQPYKEDDALGSLLNVRADDYTPRFRDGRPMFVGLKGEALSAHKADKLLADYRRRCVAQTPLRDGRERIRVSTVFLVLDRGFMNPEPMLWETAVFGGSEDGVQMRYASRDAAKNGHAAMVRMLKMVIDFGQQQRARRRRMHTAYRRRWA